MLNRKFGVELEVFDLDIKNARALLKENNITGWKCVRDFSICGCEGKDCCGETCKSCELVSPILNGAGGLAQVEQIVNALNSVGAKVNNTCGFHVHINAKDIQTEDCLRIYKRYAKFEKIIDLLHPVDRRGNNNNYCSSVIEVVEMMAEDDVSLASKLDLAELVDKYYKLNLSSLETFGTIEFRQHKGTLDFNEIQHWIKFSLEFFEAGLTPVEKDSLFRNVNESTKHFYENKIKG